MTINISVVVANRATQDTFLIHKWIWICNFYIPFFLLFWDLKSAMDCSICHCFSQVNEDLCLLSLFLLFWDLKKVPWIALLSTANFEQVIINSHLANFEQVKKHSSHFANFEQVISHFADFEQFIIKIVILLTLNKTKKTVKVLWEKPDVYALLFFSPNQVSRPILYFQPSPSQRDSSLYPTTIWMHKHPVF